MSRCTQCCIQYMSIIYIHMSKAFALLQRFDPKTGLPLVLGIQSVHSSIYAVVRYYMAIHAMQS